MLEESMWPDELDAALGNDRCTGGWRAFTGSSRPARTSIKPVLAHIASDEGPHVAT